MKKTRSLKNVCLRVITVALTICLLLSTVAFAAVTIDTDVTATDVTMTVNCGSANAGKNVVVQVFEPVGTLDDLLSDNGYDVTDAGTLDEVLCCVYQGKLNGEGSLTFTFAPLGDKGRYSVRVSVPGMTKPEELTFEFVSDGDALQIIAKLVDDLSVKAVDELFEKPENENVYKPYQILDLDESDYYAIYDGENETLVDAVNTYIYEGVKANTAITPTGFATLFDNAVLVENLNLLAGDALVEFIGNSAAQLGISENAAYTEIFLDEERFDSLVKAKFVDAVEKAELSLKTPASVGTVICEALVAAENSAIIENFGTLSGSELLSYIEKKADMLGYASRKEYKNILKNKDRFSTEVENKFIADVKDANITDVAKIADTLCQLLVKDFVSAVTAPGVLNTFIIEFETELEAAGANVDDYADCDKPNEICLDVIEKQPFSSVEDFASKLNALIPESDDDDEDNKPSKPSGIGGGISVSGSVGSNASVNIPVANPEQQKNETNAVFADIAQVAWANEAITVLKEKGIVSGRGDGNFAPNDKVTREEFVKMLSAALKLETVAEADATFSDITGTEWYAPYVYSACKAGIANGIGDAFGVGQNITRQDMAVLIARAIEYKAVTLEQVREGMAFSDEFAPYAKDAVASLWGAGLINGISETEFAPAATASRAEAAKMLYEMLKAVE